MKIHSLLNDIVFHDEKPAVQLLMESEFTKEMRIAFRNEQFMKKHTAPFPIVIEIVKGSIEFGVYDDVFTLQEGDLITLSANVPHDLKANEETIVRLTLSKKDSQERVEKVVE